MPVDLKLFLTFIPSSFTANSFSSTGVLLMTVIKAVGNNGLSGCCKTYAHPLSGKKTFP